MSEEEFKERLLDSLKPQQQVTPDEYAKAVALFYRTLIEEGINEAFAKDLTVAYVAGG